MASSSRSVVGRPCSRHRVRLVGRRFHPHPRVPTNVPANVPARALAGVSRAAAGTSLRRCAGPRLEGPSRCARVGLGRPHLTGAPGGLWAPRPAISPTGGRSDSGTGGSAGSGGRARLRQSCGRACRPVQDRIGEYTLVSSETSTPAACSTRTSSPMKPDSSSSAVRVRPAYFGTCDDADRTARPLADRGSARELTAHRRGRARGRSPFAFRP